MEEIEEMKETKKSKKPSLFSLLGSYKGLIFLLLIFALLSNGLNLVIPQIIAALGGINFLYC